MSNSIKKLQGLINQNKCPHAIILTGRNINLIEQGLIFIKWAFCCNNNKEPLRCGNCSTCKLLEANTFPDFMQIEPVKSGDNKIIKIEQVRDLIQFLQIKPQLAKLKIVMLSEAEYLNLQAANALLKILEEPPYNTYIILTISEPELLINTIRSRCLIFDIGTKDKDLFFEKDIVEKILQDLYNAFILAEVDIITLVEQWMHYETHELLTSFWLLIAKCIHINVYLQYSNLPLNLDQSSITKIAIGQSLRQLWSILDKIIEVRRNVLLGRQVNIQLFFEELMINWERNFNYVCSRSK